jgi:galactoside O-acetyltransferase
MMESDFLDPAELAQIGFRAIGRGVQVSRHALFFSPDRISLGDQVRIDAFCILAAGAREIRIGRNVHFSAYAAVLGREAVEIGDFATVSVRCTIFSSNDDYTGVAMANATIPTEYRAAVSAPVVLGEHALLGAGCIILPGVTIGESACVGALSLVKARVGAFEIVAGVPARVIGRREAGHRALAKRLLDQEKG